MFASQLLSHSTKITLNLFVAICLVQYVASSPLHTQELTSSGGNLDPLAQFHNLLREAFKYVHNINRGGGGLVAANIPPPSASINYDPGRISGQVNVRNARSESEGISKLYQLQEMDRKYGAKARPRFGKRNEVTQDNFIPMYGDEEYANNPQQQQQPQPHVFQPIGANGENSQQPLSLLFIP